MSPPNPAYAGSPRHESDTTQTLTSCDRAARGTDSERGATSQAAATVGNGKLRPTTEHRLKIEAFGVTDHT